MEVQSSRRKPHVAIFPCVGVGHFVPLAQFAKRLCVNHGFSATVITNKWMRAAKQVAYADYLASSGIDICFSELTDVDFHNDDEQMKLETRISKYMQKAAPHVGDILQSLLNSSSPISAFITDFFCTATFDVAAKLRIPTYVFFTNSARTLSLMLKFPQLASEHAVSFKDDEEYVIDVPGVPPFPARDLPQPMLDRSNQGFHWFLHHCSRLPEATGFLINTFEEMEQEALEAIKEGRVLGSSAIMPSMYSIGPVVSESHETHECLQWLDQQPPFSVVFVSFGSGGSLSREQIWELAHGLETSGHRFLWVVRGESKFLTFTPNQVADVSELLPEGFGSRTEDRGLVVLNWAPQIPILSHPSVGGFLSHSGWNSTLESISYGVPMICWPLFAEQRLNRVMLVNHNKVAIDLKEESNGFVPRAEVERVVRALMEGEEGIKVRENVRALKEKAEAALKEGGSSYKSMAMAAARLMQQQEVK